MSKTSTGSAKGHELLHNSYFILHTCFLAVLLVSAGTGFAQGSDPIGVGALRTFDPTLTGSGIVVAQPEAVLGPGNYEVNPTTTGQSGSKFFYTGTDGSTGSGFPNSVGGESDHADAVGDIFYGDNNTSNPEGVAPGVSAIYNYEADYFVNTVVNDGIPIPAQIVNESFIAVTGDNAEQAEVEQVYDDYAAYYGTLFISGVGNGGQVYSPGSCYNGIGVAAYGGSSSVGPAYDGRSKPDITAPASATSYSTPQVSGAAAILLQAALRGDARFATTGDASDSRVLKALLLNGAVKPQGWTNTPTAPLDPRYGAGIVNVYNSYMNLRAGEYASSAATSGSVSPVTSGSFVANEGWGLSTITNPLVSGTYITESNHYLFNLSSVTAPDFQLTCTLTWDKQYQATAINNLDLYLYNAITGGPPIAFSDSTVDNVQELYPMQNGEPLDLAPGEYDLVVTKNGGTAISGSGGTVVSAAETYALAFNFASVPEPGVTWLLLSGAAAFLVCCKRRNLQSRKKGVL